MLQEENHMSKKNFLVNCLTYPEELNPDFYLRIGKYLKIILTMYEKLILVNKLPDQIKDLDENKVISSFIKLTS